MKNIFISYPLYSVNCDAPASQLLYNGKYYSYEKLGTENFFSTRNIEESDFPFFVKTAKKQIHSTIVEYITSENIGTDFCCDGFVTDTKSKIGIGIRTADCTPILLADIQNGIVGACHAGWRGTVGANDESLSPKYSCVPGIAANTVKIMLDRGAAIENIKAVIGPCIHKCCFEVRDDFVKSVTDKIGKELIDRFIFSSETESGKYYADLVSLNVTLLNYAGVSIDNIYIAPICTCCNTDTLFSYRGEHKLVGTQISAIRI